MRAFEPVPRQSIVCLDDVAAQYKLAGETTDASNARRRERAVSGRARNTPETALQRPPGPIAYLGAAYMASRLR